MDEIMTDDQTTKELEYLRHCLLNSSVSLEDCLHQMENILRHMTDSVKIYRKSLNRIQDDIKATTE